MPVDHFATGRFSQPFEIDQQCRIHRTRVGPAQREGDQLNFNCSELDLVGDVEERVKRSSDTILAARPDIASDTVPVRSTRYCF